MTIRKRIWNVLTAIVMIILGILMIKYPDYGVITVAAILDIALLSSSIKNFIYYFTMGRFMVGGQISLYKAVIFLNFGMFIFNLGVFPKKLIMIYLIACMAFDGVVDIFHSLTARKLLVKNWKFEFYYGVIKLFICLVSLFFLGSIKIMVTIYAAGLFHSAISKIVTAFTKTDTVYVN